MNSKPIEEDTKKVVFNRFYLSESGTVCAKIRYQAGPKGYVEVGSEVVGYTKCDGYQAIKVNQTEILFHRLVWLLGSGEDPYPKDIDHIDGDKLNNRYSNLRLCDDSQNKRNCPAPTNNTSGYKGVGWERRCRKWYAKIKHRGKVYYGPLRETKEIAYLDRKRLEVRFHGDFTWKGGDNA